MVDTSQSFIENLQEHGPLYIAQVAPANLILLELYHESGILHFEEDHLGSPKPLSGKSKS